MNRQRNRWREFGEYIHDVPVFWVLVGVATFAVLYELGRRFIDPGDAYSLNVWTEILGVMATILIVNTWYQNRDERRRNQEMRARLLNDAIYPDSSIAQKAFYDMRVSGMTIGKKSVLRGANLFRANPGKVILNFARMERAFMWSADFSGSTFTDAILDDADIQGAKLAKTDLKRASIRNANLENADLSGADLIGADLTGANLLNADLKNVHYFIHWLNDPEEILADPDYFRQLILPNGCEAIENTDFSRFTDPKHKRFWRSNDPDSPAFIGDYRKRLDFIQATLEYRPPPTPPPFSSDPT